MRFAAVAVDYDGTLATEGLVKAPTVGALEQLGEAGVILHDARLRRRMLLWRIAQFLRAEQTHLQAGVFHNRTLAQRTLPASKAVTRAFRAPVQVATMRLDKR